jgi:hypothetical protein
MPYMNGLKKQPHNIEELVKKWTTLWAERGTPEGAERLAAAVTEVCKRTPLASAEELAGMDPDEAARVA